MRGFEQIPLLYDAMCWALEATGLRRWREWLVRGARGLSLDIGCGTGRNLPLYQVRAIGLDPSPEALAKARRRAPGIPLVRGSAEALPFRDGVFDAVVSGLVFCSVHDPVRGLAEVKRVLRPGGKLRMLEHVRSTSRLGMRVQDFIQPAWTCLAGGCHNNRDTEATVRAAGFTIDPASRRSKGTMRRFEAKLLTFILVLAAAMPAAAADLVFQAPEPDTILVVHADPELGDELALLLKKGSVEKKWLVADLLEAGELRVESGRVQWLAQVGSRVLREGVELRLASGRRVVLRFDGAGPPQKPRPVPVAELTCPCSYTDDEGIYHLVSAAADVPPEYRVRAAPVRSDAVQVIPMPPPPASPEGPAEEAPRRRASAQPAPPPPREQRPQMDYYEYIRRITGQRGPQYRVNCIGNDGKPMPCTWLEPYIIRY